MDSAALTRYRLLRRLRQRQRQGRDGHRLRNQQAGLLLIGLGVGVLVGVAEIVFRFGYSAFQFLALGFGSDLVVTLAEEQPWWRLLLGPAVGGLLIGLFIHHFMPGRRPQVVAEVIQATAVRHGRIPLWTGLKAALVNAASIGVGASVGREGPMVHLGATVGSAVARLFWLHHTSTRTLLGCGTAAGVAASFNAPIAGVFFALEVVVGHYRLHAFAPIVIASVTGTMISRLYHGHVPAFMLSETYELRTIWEFVPFATLGVVCAALAIAFMHGVIKAGPLFQRTGLPIWARTALAGLVVGGIAAAGLPHILGVGYEATDNVLAEDYGIELLVTLVAVKLLATVVCLGAGFGGGVFSPSLSMGAMIGGAYGVGVTALVPQIASSHGAYAIVGMGAVAGAVLGAPISTILIVFEMTSNYELTIAVMVATVIASTITQNLYAPSLFHKQLGLRGVDPKAAEETGLMQDVHMEDMIDPECATVMLETPIREVRKRLASTRLGEVYVLDRERRLQGAVSYRDLVARAAAGNGLDKGTARDLMHTRLPVLTRDDTLTTAVDRFDSSGVGHIPVVNNRRDMELLGVAHAFALLGAYREGLQGLRQPDRSEA